MGKYDEVIKTLPRLPEEAEDDTNYAAKVQDASNQLLKGEARILELTVNHVIQLTDESAEGMVKEWRELRDVIDKIAAVEKFAKLQLAALARLMEKNFEQRGITSLRLIDGKGARYQPEPVGKVADNDKFIEWVKSEGMERLLGVNWQRMNSIVKERLLEGLEPPDGIEVFYRPKIVKM